MVWLLLLYGSLRQSLMKKKPNYDTEIMMQITGTLGHCGEPTKFYAYYIFAVL